MSVVPVAALVLLLVAPAGAWIVQVDGSGQSHRGHAVALDAVGDVVAGGATETGTDSGDFTVAKLARADGRELWRTVLGDSSTSSFVVALALDAAGNVLAAGATADGRAVVKLAGGTGAERWRGGAVAPAAGVAVAGDGDVVVAGSATPGFGVQRLDGATGGARWSGGAALDGAAVALAPGGDVVVAGDDGLDFAVARLDGATGFERWRRVIPGAAPGPEVGAPGGAARAVAVGPDGDVFVAGAVGNGRDSDAIVARIDGASGAERWRFTVASPVEAGCARCGTDDAFAALSLDAAGHPVVTGFTGERFNPDVGPYTGSFTVMKLDATSGAPRWRFDTTPSGAEAGRALALAPGGDVFATGVTGSGDGCAFHSSPYQATVCEFTVLKLAGDTGTEVWRRVLPGLAQDAGEAIAVEPDGTPVATGTTGRFGAAAGHFTVAALEAGGGSDCGNGIVEPGEACDPIPNPGCCTAACGLVPAGTECRAAAGPCDPAGVCTGTSAACPFVAPPDADHDGVCDAVDPCIGALAIGTPRVDVRRAPRPGVTLRGTLALPFPYAPSLDPAAKGIRILVGGVDATVAAGRGWRHAGRTWSYVSRGARGITSVVVRASRRTPGLVAFRARGTGSGFNIGGGAPVAITVVLDPDGQCGTATFPGPAPAPACVLRAHGRMLRCR